MRVKHGAYGIHPEWPRHRALSGSATVDRADMSGKGGRIQAGWEKKRYRESFLGQAPSRISPERGAMGAPSVSMNVLPLSPSRITPRSGSPLMSRSAELLPWEASGPPGASLYFERVSSRKWRGDTAWIIPSLERILPSSSRDECFPMLLNMLPDLTR